jgi:hypothetical protein
MHIADIQLSFAVKTRCIMLPCVRAVPINDQTSTREAEVGRPRSGGGVQPAAAKRPRSTFWKRLSDPLALISRIMAA